jgi:hypothetical protein
MFVHDSFFRHFAFARAPTEDGQAEVIYAGGRRNLKCRLCLGALSLYGGENDIVTMMYDTEQPRVHIYAGIP